jgi:hypothetical protein
MLNKRWIICILAIILFFRPIYVMAQDSKPYKIATIVYQGDGRTKVSAFERRFGVLDGKIFVDKEGLEVFKYQLNQKIAKSRVFREFTIDWVEIGEEDGIILLSLFIQYRDGWVVAGSPLLSYTTSNGFKTGAVAVFPDIGGEMFDFGVQATYNAPPRSTGLAWSDPQYAVNFDFKNIAIYEDWMMDVGMAFLNSAWLVFDRGEDSMLYRNNYMHFYANIYWQMTYAWELLIENTYDISNGTEVEYYTDNRDYVDPSKNRFIQRLGMRYDGTTAVGLNHQGMSADMWGFYDLSQNYLDQFLPAVGFDFTLRYHWVVGKVFFPSVTVRTALHSGVVDYDLGSVLRGVVDGEMKGNGYTSVSWDFIFPLLTLRSPYTQTDFIELQGGPFIDYAVTYGFDQVFDRYDQGFSVGVRVYLFFLPLPMVPAIMDIGYDLRNKYAWNDLSRLEITFGATYQF